MYGAVSLRLLLVPALFFSVTSALADEPTSKYALLIAVTRYQDATMDATKLVYPEIDAKSVGEYLAKGGFTVEYLLGPQATRQAIQAKLRAISGKCSADGVAVIGLWGHGVELSETKETMFCPFDAKLRQLRDKDNQKQFNALNQPLVEPDPTSLVGLSQILAGLKISGAANRILLADCCRKSPHKTRAFGQSITAADLPDNTLAILACKHDQEAFEHESWGHGAMTRAFLETLPELAKTKSDFALNLVGPMTAKVSTMVHELTNGRAIQTIHQISSGNPRLGLSVEQLLNAPKLNSMTKPSLPNKSKTVNLSTEATKRLREILHAPVELSHASTPLTQVLWELGDQLTFRFVIDDESLETAGLDRETPVSADELCTLATALETVLSGLELSYYPTDDGRFGGKFVICSKELEDEVLIQAQYTFDQLAPPFSEQRTREVQTVFKSPRFSTAIDSMSGVITCEGTWSDHLQFIRQVEQYIGHQFQLESNAAREIIKKWERGEFASFADADTEYANLLSQSPLNAELWYARACLAFRSAEFKKAIAYAQKAKTIGADFEAMAQDIELISQFMCYEFGEAKTLVKHVIATLESEVSRSKPERIFRKNVLNERLTLACYGAAITKDREGLSTGIRLLEETETDPGCRFFFCAIRALFDGDFAATEKYIRQAEKSDMDRGFCYFVYAFAAATADKDDLATRCVQWSRKQKSISHLSFLAAALIGVHSHQPSSTALAELGSNVREYQLQDAVSTSLPAVLSVVSIDRLRGERVAPAFQEFLDDISNNLTGVDRTLFWNLAEAKQTKHRRESLDFSFRLLLCEAAYDFWLYSLKKHHK